MNHIKSFELLVCFSFLFAMLGVSIVRGEDAKNNGKYIVYVGTYTSAKSKGIYSFAMDPKTGALTPLGLAADAPNPTFLELDEKGKFLYAANEVGAFDGKSVGSVSAFSIEPGTGKLSLLDTVSAGGGGTCHIIIDRTGKNALVANYGGGSAAVLPIKPDGSLGEASAFVQHEGHSVNHQRQEKPHGHCVALDKANRFAFVCDLGIDKVMIYKFDAAKGSLMPNDPPFVTVTPGAGPRHMLFSKDGKFAYLVNELAGTVTVFSYDAKHGALTEVQTISALPDGFKDFNLSAEIALAPSGKFLYVSNRGHDSIAIFAIDKRKGTLTVVDRQSTLGKTPRHFEFDPSGKFVIAADQESNKLVVFAFDPKTGRLNPTGNEAEVPAPVCVKFLKMR